MPSSPFYGIPCSHPYPFSIPFIYILRKFLVTDKSFNGKRLVKEAAYYEEEVSENEAKLEEMRNAKKDPHDIKKFQEVLGESQMMVPVSTASRDKSLEDLNEFITLLREEEGDNNDLMGCEWMGEARKLLGLTESMGEEKRNGDGEEVEITATLVPGLEDGEAF